MTRANPNALRAPAQSRLVLAMVSVLVVIMVVPDSFNYEILLGDAMPGSGSPLWQLLWLFMFAGSLSLLGARLGATRQLLKSTSFWLLAFVALAAASVLWSIEPGVTLRRLFRMVTVLLVAASAALHGRPGDFQSMLRPVVTTLLAGSILMALQLPDYGIEQADQAELVGAWRGMTTQKNMLGALASIGSLLWLHAWLGRQVRVPAALAGLAIAVTCLLKSRSSTSIMATVFAAMLMLLLMRPPHALRRSLPYLVGGFVGLLLLYSLAVLRLVPGLDFVLRPITMITGKDLTFSGRTAIWDIINQHIALRPMLGSGYGAYWVKANPLSPSFDMVRQLYFYPTEAHNGYVDVINDLGAVGGAILVCFLLSYVRQSLRVMRSDRLQATLYLVLLFEQLVANLSESMWMNVLSVEFVIMMMAALALGRSLLEQRRLATIGGWPASAGLGQTWAGPG